ncbi:MAG TPA: hypothetical protein VMI54_26540 [Polyangiaceae bacterium]|nr:hypothetical protein [Polyangiaceae bacterium]
MLLAATATAAWSPPSSADVTEPNGVVVPVKVASGGVYLGDWFTQQGEMIDAVKDASAVPGAFSPLCDFSATLVLHDSSAKAGISWYNTTTGATGPLTTDDVWPIVPPGTAVGTTITSADIRTSTHYANGLVGFVLVRDDDNDDSTPPTLTYYSEYQRNAFCSGCTGTNPTTGLMMTPDYWKAALIYPSTMLGNTFYLAFEDWGGAGATPDTWYNDGDFNDEVFRVTGVACPGSGTACDTGQPGVCGPGLTECVAGGTLDCKPQVSASAETCDGLDNDCNGVIDDGDLCPSGQVCDRGSCVARCSDLADTCKSTEVCSDAGFCVDAACADVTCDPGQKCVAGTCKAPCEDVVCPPPSVCLAGRCADPCDGVTCESGRVCDGGVCVPNCSCQVCGAGLECAADGRCVSAGCAGKTCDAGEVCSAGSCVDACDGARCPTGEKCVAGACVDACSDVTCDAGQKCLAGNCTDSCTGVHCLPGQNCVPGDDNQGACVAASDCTTTPCANPNDRCVDGTCENPCMACTSTESCQNGACVDACTGVSCGADQTCKNGVCVSTAPPPATGGTAGTNASGGAPATGGSAATGGASAAGGSANATGGTPSPSAGSGALGDDTPVHANPGCACTLRRGETAPYGVLAALAAAGVFARRRKRSAR